MLLVSECINCIREGDVKNQKLYRGRIFFTRVRPEEDMLILRPRCSF